MRCFWGPNNYGTAIPKSPCHAPIHVLNPEYVWEVSGRLVVEGPTMSNPYLHQHHPWAQMGVGLPSFRSFYRPYEKKTLSRHLHYLTARCRGFNIVIIVFLSAWMVQTTESQENRGNRLKNQQICWIFSTAFAGYFNTINRFPIPVGYFNRFCSGILSISNISKPRFFDQKIFSFNGNGKSSTSSWISHPPNIQHSPETMVFHQGFTRIWNHLRGI